MDKKYEKKYHAKEEQNWWFVARRNTILSLLYKMDKNARILDIGCAGGSLLSSLKNQGFKNVTGIDYSEDAVAKCKEKGLETFLMDAHHLQFESNTFDVLIASDSLEHLEFDEEALKNWFDILKTNGKLIVFVPAYQFLWSHHDIINHHFRRYTKTGLIDKLQKAGFIITRGGYWNFTLLFPTMVFRLLQQSKNKIYSTNNEDQLRSFNPFINYMLIFLLRMENIIFKLKPFFCGVSVYVSAIKK